VVFTAAMTTADEAVAMIEAMMIADVARPEMKYVMQDPPREQNPKIPAMIVKTESSRAII